MNRKKYNVDERPLDIISITNKWYTNEPLDFHTAYTVNGTKYELDRTNFAKRLCADDANLIEMVEINVSKNNTVNDTINQILTKNNFLTMYRKQVEQMSANGTVGAYVYVENADIFDDGTFTNGEIKIQYCDSLNIVPLTVVNNEIIESAFTDHAIENNKDIYSLIIFSLVNGSYVAERFYFDDKGNEFKDRQQTVQMADVKPFAIMRTAENNNLKMKGYGYPKLWSAIPCLKVIDLSMTMWRRDLEKSDKLVLINEALAKHDKDNKVVPPNEAMKKIFVQIGQQKLPEENSLYQEYNPTVRMEEIQQSIELALSMLAMSFGFGTKKYTFENGRILTATEYAGERQDSMQEINKQRSESIKYISGIIDAIVYFYNLTQGSITVDEVKVDFDDSYVEDKTAIAKQMREDALAFDIPTLKIWYFQKQYNLTKEEAKKLLDEIDLQNDDGDADDE